MIITQAKMVTIVSAVIAQRSQFQRNRRYNGCKGLRIGTKYQQCYVLKKIADTDGSNQYGQFGCMSQRLVGHLLNNNTQNKAGNG